MTENEVEDKLTSFITVFKYIDDKDIFQKVQEAFCATVYPNVTQFEALNRSKTHHICFFLVFFSFMPEC